MKTATLLLMSLLLAGCSLFPSVEQKLEQNQAKWHEKNIHDYRFDLTIGSLWWPGADLMPLSIEVKNGAAMSVKNRKGQDETSYLETFLNNATIDSLFAVIQSAQDSGANDIKVTYDPKFGFPKIISIDYEKIAIDDEIGYYVENFEVIDP
jgi:hypothetical protein